MRRMILVVIVVVALFVVGPVWGQVVVSIHNHTDKTKPDGFSDGAFGVADTARRAFVAGAQVVFITDHAHQIVDADEYVSEIKAADRLFSDDGRRIVPGMEIGRSGHFLVLGGDTGRDVGKRFSRYTAVAGMRDRGEKPTLYKVLVAISKQFWSEGSSIAADHAESMFNDIVEAAKACGAVTIACHPLYDDGVMQYKFDLSLDKIAGLEFLNYGVKDDAADELELLARPRPFVVTAGADFHGTIGATLGGRIAHKYIPEHERFTVVCTSSSDPAKIVDSISRGMSYGTFGEARMIYESGYTVPGQKIDPGKPIRMGFTRLESNEVTLVGVTKKGQGEVAKLSGSDVEFNLVEALPQLSFQGGWLYVWAGECLMTSWIEVKARPDLDPTRPRVARKRGLLDEIGNVLGAIGQGLLDGMIASSPDPNSVHVSGTLGQILQIPGAGVPTTNGQRSVESAQIANLPYHGEATNGELHVEMGLTDRYAGRFFARIWSDQTGDEKRFAVPFSTQQTIIAGHRIWEYELSDPRPSIRVAGYKFTATPRVDTVYISKLHIGINDGQAPHTLKMSVSTLSRPAPPCSGETFEVELR